MDKTEPDIGACLDARDCNDNGECKNHICKCDPGFEEAIDCLSKISYFVLIGSI